MSPLRTTESAVDKPTRLRVEEGGYVVDQNFHLLLSGY